MLFLINKEPVGTQYTAGFVAHHMIYSLVWVLPSHGYSVRRYRYSVGKPDLRVTHIEP